MKKKFWIDESECLANRPVKDCGSLFGGWIMCCRKHIKLAFFLVVVMSFCVGFLFGFFLSPDDCPDCPVVEYDFRHDYQPTPRYFRLIDSLIVTENQTSFNVIGNDFMEFYHQDHLHDNQTYSFLFKKVPVDSNFSSGVKVWFLNETYVCEC